MAKTGEDRTLKLLIIRNAFTHDFGGAERLAVHLADESTRNGIHTTVVSRQPRLLGYARSSDIPTVKGWWWSRQDWSGKKALLFPAYLVWQVALTIWYVILVVRLRPDTIHAMSKDDFISATFAGKLFGKTVVWTDPADLKHIFRNHRVWYKNPVGKLVYLASKLADNIMLVSNSEKKIIEESLEGTAPENFVVVHIAGRDEIVTPLKRDTVDKDAVIFCSTSRLVIAKGIKELVEAFNLLSKDSDKYRLWLVGDGPDEKLFKDAAGGNKYIHFIGHSDKPLPYVAASDIFMQPTHHEGFSLALAEAAMLGKPMIASDVGGNPELVNNKNGLLFPVHDVSALKKAMADLASSKETREKLGAQARKDYVEKFNFSTVVKNRIIPLYEK